MNGEYFLMFGVPLFAFLGALFPAFWMAKAKNNVGLICFSVIWAGFTGAMFFGMENASGWDGLGYMMGLIGISAPTGVAGLIGSAVGWHKGEKAMHA